MIVILGKVGRVGVKTPRIRSGKERVINLFDVNVVKLMEALGRDRKYWVGLVSSYGAVGDRVCDRHQKIFN